MEDAGRLYFDARILGAPAVLLNYVLIGWLLGRERSKEALLLSAVGNGANIILDYWFIYQLGWGSQGAGWATALSQYTMLGMGLLVLSRIQRQCPWKDIVSGLREKDVWRRLFGLNRDILVRTMSLQTAFALFTNLSALQGTGILVANTVLLKVLSLASFFIDGYAYATESLSGYYFGQRRYVQLKALLLLTIRASCWTAFALVSIFVGFPDQMFGLMTHHRPVLDEIALYSLWLYPVVGLGAIAYALDGYFIGLTLSVTMRRAMLFSLAIFIAALGFAYSSQNNHLLWGAWAVFMGARVVTLGRRTPQTWSVQG